MRLAAVSPPIPDPITMASKKVFSCVFFMDNSIYLEQVRQVVIQDKRVDNAIFAMEVYGSMVLITGLPKIVSCVWSKK